MKRREFITLLGGTAVGLPLTAGAQQAAMPVIGWLGPDSRASEDFRVVPFRQGLKEAGYSEGQNIAIEYRWDMTGGSALDALADDLARLETDLIVVSGAPAALAAAVPDDR